MALKNVSKINFSRHVHDLCNSSFLVAFEVSKTSFGDKKTYLSLKMLSIRSLLEIFVLVG